MPDEVLSEGKYRRFIRRDGWEYIERMRAGGIVVMIAVTEDRKLVLVEQLRVPVSRPVIEFPAGLMNDLDSNQHESAEQTARRELIEETGYEAREMVRINEGPACPATSNDILTIFHARGLKKIGQGGGDATENIIVHEVPLDGVEAWLLARQREGKLVDFKVYAGLYYLQGQRGAGPL